MLYMGAVDAIIVSGNTTQKKHLKLSIMSNCCETTGKKCFCFVGWPSESAVPFCAGLGSLPWWEGQPDIARVSQSAAVFLCSALTPSDTSFSSC